LGYYLLYVPNREDDAIRYSQKYHQLFPDESDTLFNVACAYAQKYCCDIRRNRGSEPTATKNRQLALDTLKEALGCEPEFAETIREKWTQKGESFECLTDDAEYRALVGLPRKS
jgi:hypothetical protein